MALPISPQTFHKQEESKSRSTHRHLSAVTSLFLQLQVVLPVHGRLLVGWVGWRVLVVVGVVVMVGVELVVVVVVVVPGGDVRAGGGDAAGGMYPGSRDALVG